MFSSKPENLNVKVKLFSFQMMMDICADNGRIFSRVHKRPPNKPDASARIYQREQSLKDNLIVFLWAALCLMSLAR